MPRRSDDAREAAGRVLQFLAGTPGGHTTVVRATLRELLLSTDGTMMACGTLYNIKSKHIGAGVYDVRLEPRP